MGCPPSTTTTPGWYPDPWYPQSARYWDGATWTAHAQSTGYGPPRVDPDSVRGWGRKAGIAFLVQTGCNAFAAVVGPVVVGHSVARMFSSIESGSEPDALDGAYLVGNAAMQVLSLAGIAALILLIVWSHHITSTARALGLPTTHTPGWAIAGWIVPIVNLWFPYQIVRDALPETDDARAFVPAWWALTVGGQVLTFAAFVGATISTGFGIAMGVVVAALYLGAGLLGRRLALAIAAAHEARAGSLLGVHP